MRRIALSTPAAILILLSVATTSGAQPAPAGTPTDPMFLAQNWKGADRTWFYTISQGSQMMPYAWFLALEQPDSETPFRADSLTRYGYLPNPDKKSNPDGLAIGFVKNVDDRGEWLGMTCAACHTSQMTFAGKTLQIDGGPTNANMSAFLKALGSALTQTAAGANDPKFGRFANTVLPAGHSPVEEAKLLADLKEFATRFGDFVTHSTPKEAWGPARLDAFGLIFNRATAIDLDEPGNNHEANAPVSYPFLWDTSWHDKVQWNGSAPNKTPLDRLARNVGEVLGVFAHADLKDDVKRSFGHPLYFVTSAKRLNQLLIEARVKELRSPAWPSQLAKIDAAKAAEGKKLYATYCLKCHAIVARNQPNRNINVTMTSLAEVRTDPLMAKNAVTLTSKSGVLTGVRMPNIPFLVPPLEETEPSFNLVGHIVIGAILAPADWSTTSGALSGEDTHLVESLKTGRLGQQAHGGAQDLLRTNLLAAAKQNMAQRAANVDALAYRARPLDGIWATAPYLHNGSVANLYQLLLPADQRDKTFYVGSREFDPDNVGFRSGKTDGAFLLDTSIQGNLNTGHDGPDYGTDKLDETKRRQLVEYLKTL